MDLQAFFGYYLLVSPVTEENSTSVDIYLPDDQFYDFYTYEPIRGEGKNMSLSDIDYTSIPLHIRGGGILPMRTESAMTTKVSWRDAQRSGCSYLYPAGPED